MDVTQFYQITKNDETTETSSHFTKLLQQKKITEKEYDYCINYIRNKCPLIGSGDFDNIVDKLPKSTKTNKLFDNIIKNNNVDEIISRMKKMFSDSIYLIDERIEAITMLLNLFKDSNEYCCGMFGYAGTGKTTLIVEFIRFMLATKLISSVAFTSPTHKALNVMKTVLSNTIQKLMQDVGCESKQKFDENLEELKQHGIAISFMTLHSLMDYRMELTNGEKKFVRQKTFKKNASPKMSEYDVIIIDECSMIPICMIDTLFDDIQKRKCSTEKNAKSIKIIFTGDPAQLPPVNEITSAIFLKSNKDLPYNMYINNIVSNVNTMVSDEYTKKKYSMFIEKILTMHTMTLKHIFRNSRSNVNDICYNIRQWIIDGNTKLQLTKYIGNGVYVYKSNGSSENKINSKWFKKCVEKFAKGDMSCIVLTWTNRSSDLYNGAIRKILLNKTIVGEYEVGDVLILRDFYSFGDDNQQDDDQTAFYTSEQIKILKLSIEKRDNQTLFENMPNAIKLLKESQNIIRLYKIALQHINRNASHKYMAWKMTVKRILENNVQDDREYIMYVIHSQSREQYEDDRKYVEKVIKQIDNAYKSYHMKQYRTIERNIINALWKFYDHTYVSAYADVVFGYSVTTHKAQGSTFTDIFVDANDILGNSDENVMKRCLYTSHTRCSNELHILL